MTHTNIADDEATILDIERFWWVYSGRKEQVIRERLGISTWAFYQRLNKMLDDPRIESAEPVLVHRLQRVRAAGKH